MSKRARIPGSLWTILDRQISAAAARLKELDQDNRGYSNDDVRQLLHDEAMILLADFVSETVDDVLTRRITLVLGGSQEGIEFGDEQGFLPNLEMPTHFSVPQEDGTAPRWKRKDDLSPNDLRKVLRHRKKVTAGFQSMTTKIELMLETAVRRGCDEDKPVSSVNVP